MSDATRGPWYWCLTHNRLEPEEGCANIDRLGPYETKAQAEGALERAHENTDKWEAEDDSWR